MDIKQIKQKALSEGTQVSVEDLNLINQHTLVPLTPEEVYIFKVQICDNDVDRVGDKMSDAFLEQVAEHIKGVTGLKDHDWSVGNQVARLYDAEVVTDPDALTVLGEPRKYVLGKAYTLSKYRDLIDNINAGILKETSISFNSEGDTCSICGCPMVKDSDDVGHCENSHIAGHTYDEKLCFNNLDRLKDILEWSLVAVPCQPKAGINKKNIGGSSIMKKAELLIRQFMSSKSYEKAAPEDKAALDEAVSKAEDIELSDEDIKKLLDENGKLKAKVKDLEDAVKLANDGREHDKIEAIISKELDNLKPLTQKVKEMMLKDIPWDSLKLEDGQIPGMDDVFAGIKDAYKGLFVEEEDIEKIGGHDEPDGDEAAVINVDTKGEPDGDEGKIMIDTKELETPEVKSKGLKSSGITFGVNSKSKNNSIKQKIGWHWD